MSSIYIAIIAGIIIGYGLRKRGYKKERILNKATSILILTLILMIGIGIGLEINSINMETITTILTITILNITIPILFEAIKEGLRG
ncbi:MAG: hypothetical protein QXI93_03365 [Candidatus Methanomethylicia archaeon]